MVDHCDPFDEYIHQQRIAVVPNKGSKVGTALQLCDNQGLWALLIKDVTGSPLIETDKELTNKGSVVRRNKQRPMQPPQIISHCDPL